MLGEALNNCYSIFLCVMQDMQLIDVSYKL
jgi:hypothetical protein